mmetsp:Transcript_7529/g.6668  ORF Transcript_7529/g.6668 Transcript_7529/m.6668 type:complete len:153 (-) Transcript_7529:111-569(-)
MEELIKKDLLDTVILQIIDSDTQVPIDQFSLKIFGYIEDEEDENVNVKIKEHRRAEFQRILTNLYKQFGVQYLKQQIKSAHIDIDYENDSEESKDNSQNSSLASSPLMLSKYILKSKKGGNYNFSFKVKLRSNDQKSYLKTEGIEKALCKFI